MESITSIVNEPNGKKHKPSKRNQILPRQNKGT